MTSDVYKQFAENAKKLAAAQKAGTGLVSQDLGERQAARDYALRVAHEDLGIQALQDPTVARQARNNPTALEGYLAGSMGILSEHNAEAFEQNLDALIRGAPQKGLAELSYQLPLPAAMQDQSLSGKHKQIVEAHARVLNLEFALQLYKEGKLGHAELAERVMPYVVDRTIGRKLVNETCERCRANDCKMRAAPPPRQSISKGKSCRPCKRSIRFFYKLEK